LNLAIFVHLKAKEECVKEGIEKPSHSDAIRWLWKKLEDRINDGNR